jgi:hypothetical protein
MRKIAGLSLSFAGVLIVGLIWTDEGAWETARGHHTPYGVIVDDETQIETGRRLAVDPEERQEFVRPLAHRLNLLALRRFQ